MDRDEVVSSDSESDQEDQVKNVAKPNTKKKGCFSSTFQSIAGNAILEKSDLELALKALKDRLLTKNVVEKIVEKLCESVTTSLEGKRLGHSIDILRDVHAAKEQGKPYVVVFVGVNGVGKSTNLAK
ncbi:hypothetical protein ACLOJK_040868, partial [Asimina triloba]